MTKHQKIWKGFSLRKLLLAQRATKLKHSLLAEETGRRLRLLALYHVHRRLGHLALASADLEDVAHELVVAFLQAVDRYKPELAAPTAYFAVIASNRLSHWLAKRNRDKLVFGVDMSEAVDNRDQVSTEDLSEVVERLPPRLRHAVQLLLDGKTTLEIAKECDSTPDAVRRLLFRAREELRPHLSR